jgi:hypothetical protein
VRDWRWRARDGPPSYEGDLLGLSAERLETTALEAFSYAPRSWPKMPPSPGDGLLRVEPWCPRPTVRCELLPGHPDNPDYPRLGLSAAINQSGSTVGLPGRHAGEGAHDADRLVLNRVPVAVLLKRTRTATSGRSFRPTGPR